MKRGVERKTKRIVRQIKDSLENNKVSGGGDWQKFRQALD